MNTTTYVMAGSWFFLALLSVGVALAKKRSPLNWFLLTMVFGPLAMISLLVQPSLEPHEE